MLYFPLLIKQLFLSQDFNAKLNNKLLINTILD